MLYGVGERSQKHAIEIFFLTGQIWVCYFKAGNIETQK